MKKFSNNILTLLSAAIFAGAATGAAFAESSTTILFVEQENSDAEWAAPAVDWAPASDEPEWTAAEDDSPAILTPDATVYDDARDASPAAPVPTASAPSTNAPTGFSSFDVAPPAEAAEGEADEGPFKFGGYLNAGYLGNTLGSKSNGDVSAGSERGGALNGVYASLVKEVDASANGIDWGGGVDFAFGQDARYTRVENGLDETWVTGHNRNGDATYGFALPQAYADVAVGKWVGTFGHFYTPLGYESIRADERFFYSTGLGFDVFPATHTGARLRYDGFERFTPRVSFVNGADQGFSDKVGGKLVLADFTFEPTDNLALFYGVAAGNVEDYLDDAGSRQKTFGSMHSWTAEWTANERWTFAGEASFYPSTSCDGDDGGKSETTAFGQHTTLTLSDAWKLGSRVEWKRDKTDGATDERFALTFGANWSPAASEHLTIRPEIRYDSGNVPQYGKAADKVSQTCLGLDALARF